MLSKNVHRTHVLIFLLYVNIYFYESIYVPSAAQPSREAWIASPGALDSIAGGESCPIISDLQSIRYYAIGGNNCPMIS